MTTLKVTWDTYLKRRELKSLWAIYSYEEEAYLLNSEVYLINEIESLWLEVEKIDFIELNEAYEVKQKNLRAERKAERYNKLAWKRYQESSESSLSEHERDFLKLWEPVKVWHHSQRRHEKLLEKVDRDFEKRWQAMQKAEEYENKAEYWENKKYLTSEEKKAKKEYKKSLEEKAMELWIKDHEVWQEFECFANSTIIIIKKINKKTIISETWSKWEIEYARDFDKYLKQAKELL